MHEQYFAVYIWNMEHFELDVETKQKMRTSVSKLPRTVDCYEYCSATIVKPKRKFSESINLPIVMIDIKFSDFDEL